MQVQSTGQNTDIANLSKDMGNLSLKSGLLSLPGDTHIKCAEGLDVRSLLRFKTTCKTFRALNIEHMILSMTQTARNSCVNHYVEKTRNIKRLTSLLGKNYQNICAQVTALITQPGRSLGEVENTFPRKADVTPYAELFPNLKEFVLYSLPAVDVRPIGKLRTLEKIFIKAQAKDEEICSLVEKLGLHGNLSDVSLTWGLVRGPNDNWGDPEGLHVTNSFSDRIFKALTCQKNLTHLHLGLLHVFIGQLPDVTELPKLRQLTLDNAWTSSSRTLGCSNTLETLHLCIPYLPELAELPDFDYFPNLRNLHLSKIASQAVSIQNLSLRKLELLAISDSHFTVLPDLRKLPSLIELRCNGMPKLKDEALQHLCSNTVQIFDLSVIRNLHFAETAITRVPDLSGLIQLRKLDLKGVCLSAKNPFENLQSRSLEELRLDPAQIHYVPDVHRLPNLRVFNFCALPKNV